MTRAALTLHAALALAKTAARLDGLAAKLAARALGDGDVYVADGVIQTVVPCPRCNGEGCRLIDGDTCDHVEFVSVERHDEVAEFLKGPE